MFFTKETPRELMYSSEKIASRKQPPPPSMAYLPDDVLSDNIFIRLPAKQLAQMRSLSKPWNAFLSRPDFIKSHLARSIKTNDEILLLFYQRSSLQGSNSFTIHPSRSPNLRLTNLIKLPVNLPKELTDEYNCIIGSVNGLIGIASYKWDEKEYINHIWNPSLSALITLPPYTKPPLGHLLLWFGFDPKADDYKVVKLTHRFHISRLPLNEIYSEVEVYSMRENSWKFINSNYPSNVRYFMCGDEVCVNGHDGILHWIACIDEEVRRNSILAFNLSEEIFSKISLPYSIQGYNNYDFYLVLGIMGGKICVMSTDRDGGFEVWVMNEYGVANSWVKQHVYSQFNGLIDPFGFTLNNEFMFGVGHRIALYDPNAALVKLFNVTRPLRSVYTVVQYVDSLVWVSPAKRDISCSSSISLLE